MSGPQRVTITYTAPSSFLSTDHWKQVHAALQSQLPLRNLHWKSASRPTLRTIQQLGVNLVAVDALRDEHTSQVPQTILEKPLLNAYIVVCEVSYACLHPECACLGVYVGHRNIQEHCKEADQGLAFHGSTAQEPGMADHTYCPTRLQVD